MKTSLKVLIGLVVLLLAFVLIVPLGIRTGVEFVSFEPTPESHKELNRRDGYTTDKNMTTVLCKYFVQGRIDAIPTWRYTDGDMPDPPNCELVTLYWHDSWLFPEGTILF